MKRFKSVVTDIRLQRQVGLAAVWEMSLEATEFRPGETGVLTAETRTGTRLEIAVTGVVAGEDGVMWHVVEKPLAAGTDVVGVVGA